MRALSMSFLLAENNANNGPLMVIPGSHRSFLACVGETPENHYLSSLKKQEYGVPDEDSLAEMAFEKGIVAPTGKPGTVIIFDCNLKIGRASCRERVCKYGLDLGGRRIIKKKKDNKTKKKR